MLADALTERGDPRGELILLDLALGDTEGPEEQEIRRNELRYRLLPRICRSENTRAQYSWRFGFIDRVVVGEWQTWYGKVVRDVWTHDSLRLLRQLSIGSNPSDWMVSTFPALRHLEIKYLTLDKLPSLPRLEVLTLSCRVETASVEMLATMLGDRKLTRIDLTSARIINLGVEERLAQLCVELVK